METLFDVEPTCPTCGGSERVWSQRLGAMVACKCVRLPRVDRQEVQLPVVSTDTQQAAALSALPRSGTARRLVLEYIFVTRGATDEEVQTGLRMGANTQRPRRVELLRDGWIEDSGQRRQTLTKHESIVWVLTERGRREYTTKQGGDAVGK